MASSVNKNAMFKLNTSLPIQKRNIWTENLRDLQKLLMQVNLFFEIELRILYWVGDLESICFV